MPDNCAVAGTLGRIITMHRVPSKEREPAAYVIALTDALHGTAMSITLDQQAASVLGETLQAAVRTMG